MRIAVGIQRFWRDRAGATAIEYGLIAALIALTIIAGLTLLGGGVDGLWTTVGARVGAALGG